jgi:DNA-directed RNA polymerase specialized sigma24 family protein
VQTVLDALDVIRRGGDERQLSRALQWLGRELDRRFGARAEHFDVRQLVLVKVVRHAGSCRAAAPGAANRWLDTIYRRSSIDHARARAREPRLSRAGVLPEEEAPSEPLPEGLAEQMVDELFARLEEHLEVRIRRVHERAAASLRAELAWERHVEGRAPAELAEALSLRLAEPPKTDTLYKWI